MALGEPPPELMAAVVQWCQPIGPMGGSFDKYLARKDEWLNSLEAEDAVGLAAILALNPSELRDCGADHDDVYFEAAEALSHLGQRHRQSVIDVSQLLLAYSHAYASVLDIISDLSDT